MIYQFKPDNDVILIKSDDNELNISNSVLIKDNIDDITVRCLISYIKFRFNNTEYYIIELNDYEYKIKFLNENNEHHIYVNFEKIFVVKDTLFILMSTNITNILDETKQFNLMKNRIQKIDKLCSK